MDDIDIMISPGFSNGLKKCNCIMSWVASQYKYRRRLCEDHLRKRKTKKTQFRGEDEGHQQSIRGCRTGSSRFPREAQAMRDRTAVTAGMKRFALAQAFDSHLEETRNLFGTKKLRWRSM
ncbi:uncharacterized protein DMAD_07827 [Drosophila madeirensis]|uniref:Uncharacterized protein n=1 Tax=Drosophila madeirensis TaxID=30013 RepID=A0AAU9EPQ9_DROMD